MCCSGCYQKEESGSLTEEPKLPRVCKAPRRIDHGSSPHMYACAKDMYCHAYFEALGLVSEKVERSSNNHSPLGTINVYFLN